MNGKPSKRNNFHLGITIDRSARWRFDLTGLAGDVLKVRGGSHCVGKERLIQQYLDVVQYDVWIIIRPNLVPLRDFATGKRGNYIEFRRASATFTAGDLFIEQEIGGMGLTLIINARDICDYVLQRAGVSTAELYTPMSIKLASEVIWPEWSRNMRGVVHNWMVQTPPVFLPEEPVVKRNPKGARLSLADQVTIGILHGMFSFEVHYAALQEPVEFTDR